MNVLRFLAPLLSIASLLLGACAPLPWTQSAQFKSNQPVFSQAAAAYEMLDLEWYDAARQRAVPVRLYFPKAAAKDGTAPLVLFSHGMGGSRNGYSYLADDWASHGIASLHVQHVGSDRSVWEGSALSVLLKLQTAAGADEALARVQDLRFALDQILASPYASRINANQVAVAGHSYGANTSMLAAGAQVMRDGAPLRLVDGRIKAAILISSPPFYGESDFAPILRSVSVPSLHITSTGDVIDIPGFRSESEDRIRIFDAMGGAKLLAVFKGGSHSMFTDRANTGGVELNPLVKRATSELTRIFLAEQLLRRPQEEAFAAWRMRHAGIVERFNGPALLADGKPLN